MERTFQKTVLTLKPRVGACVTALDMLGEQLVQWSSHECNFSGRLSWKEVIAVGVLQDCFVDNTHAWGHYSDSENSLRNAIKTLTGKQPERASGADRRVPWRKSAVHQCPKLKCQRKKWHLQRWNAIWNAGSSVNEASLASLDSSCSWGFPRLTDVRRECRTVMASGLSSNLKSAVWELFTNLLFLISLRVTFMRYF